MEQRIIKFMAFGQFYLFLYPWVNLYCGNLHDRKKRKVTPDPQLSVGVE